MLLPGFEGCGRLLRCDVTAMCQEQGNQECRIDFRLWRRTETGLFTLVNSNPHARNPRTNPLVQEMLSFPLDMEFTVGDMVGFYLARQSLLMVHTAPAGNHSYLQWDSGPKPSSTLNSADATPIMSRLPILNVEGKCELVLDTLHMILCHLHVYGHPLIHLWFKLHHADTAIII